MSDELTQDIEHKLTVEENASLKIQLKALQEAHEQLKAEEGVRLWEGDPFESVLIEMTKLQREKSKDYAAPGNPLKNMHAVVDALDIPGYTVAEDCNAMVIRKTARIANLRGRAANNESVRDSYLDRAVYAVLALVALDEPVIPAYEDKLP